MLAHYAAKLRRNALVKVKTAAYTVSAKNEDVGATFSNLGATGSVTFTLPSAVQGLSYHFVLEAAQTLTVTAGSSDHFVDSRGVDTADAASISSAKIGNYITIVCLTDEEWTVIEHVGLWTNYNTWSMTLTFGGTGAGTGIIQEGKIIIDLTTAAEVNKSVTCTTPIGFKILDAWSIHGDATAAAWQIKNTATAVTDAVSAAASGKDIARASSIDDAQNAFTAGDDDLVIAITTGAFKGKIVIPIEMT